MTLTIFLFMFNSMLYVAQEKTNAMIPHFYFIATGFNLKKNING